MNIEDTISKFSEGETLLNRKAELTRELKRVRRRLKTMKSEYSFLKDMLEATSGEDFELYMVKYFKSLNFYDKVVHTGNHSEKEDIQLWLGNHILLIETRNTETRNPNKDDIGQLEWRKHQNKKSLEFKGYSLFYTMVFSHQSKYDIKSRKKNPLHGDIKDKLIADGNSFVTAIDLFDAFIKIKRNELTLEDFNKKLNQVGLVEF